MIYYDLNTKNQSFLDFAQHLKDKNVKNYASHLVLYDKELIGVDPRSEDLTEDQKIRIFTELTINPWYYFREFVRYEGGSREGHMFECNIGSYMIVWSHIKNLNTFTVLSRQSGKTTTHLAFFSYVMLFIVTNQFFVFSLQEHSAKKTILEKWRWYIDSLPDWMKPLVTDYNDQNSTEEKSLFKQKNKILCFGGAVNDEGADKSARSFTTSNLFMDEVAFFRNNKAFYGAAIQATNTAIMNAKKNGTPYGIHLTTTPNRRDEGSPHGMWAYEFFNSAAPFRYDILDMNDDELKEYLSNNSFSGSKPNGFLRLEFDWRQLGRDQEWYDKAIMDSNNDLKKIKQELDLEWPLTDQGSVFTEEELERVNASVREIRSHIKLLGEKYYLDLYEPINIFANYIISIDTASGFGIDGTAINIIDPIDYHIVGSMNYNTINSEDLHYIILELMREVFRESYLVIEAAPIAIPVLQRLVKEQDLERRIFKQLVERDVQKKLSDGTVKTEKTKVWRYGVNTNATTRSQMMDLMLTIVRDTPHIITSPHVFNDLRNLQYHRGKIQAINKTHDDSIMSYLITRWAIAYGKYFKGKRMVGGELTRNLLVEGSQVLPSHIEEAGNFYGILSLSDNPVVSGLSGKTISSHEYAKREEEKEKEESNKRRKRFLNLMG